MAGTIDNTSGTINCVVGTTLGQGHIVSGPAILVSINMTAKNGLVLFVENNPAILATEIVLTVLITAFAIFVFIAQLKRLREKRNSDTHEKR